MASYHEPKEKIFYKQAKFMEDFEYNFNEQGEFYHHYPTYQNMSSHQIRGYFSWRTNVRRGIIEKTSISFVFVYIYELLNQIGASSPEEGFHTLKNFWAAYKEIDSYIDSYIELWLKDYVVYNNLDKSLLEGLFDTNYNNAVLTLFNYKSHNADEVFSALNVLSPYNLRNSSFFKQYSDDVKNVVFAVYSALSDYYDKKGKDSLCEVLFGKFYTRSYYMFNSAVFYNQICQKDFTYEINDFCKYTCKDGKWKCKSFFPYEGINKQHIRAIFKHIDSIMRKKYSFKPTVNAGKIDEHLHDIISNVIDEYRKKQIEAARPKIEIDVSMLQNIRKASLETQSKLLVEELEETNAVENFDKTAAPENDTGLSDTEYFFMKCLLYGQAYGELIQSKGLLLSVLVDAVNEKLFDRFGDTVINECEGRPELIEDYVEELKGIIR